MSSTPQSPHTSQSESNKADAVPTGRAINQDHQSKETHYLGTKKTGVAVVLSLVIVIGILYFWLAAKREQEDMVSVAQDCALFLVGDGETLDSVSIAEVLPKQEVETGITAIIKVRYDMSDPVQVRARVSKVTKEELPAFARDSAKQAEVQEPSADHTFAVTHRGSDDDATLVYFRHDGIWMAECELMPQ